jgi:hypothetical protein
MVAQRQTTIEAARVSAVERQAAQQNGAPLWSYVTASFTIDLLVTRSPGMIT